MREVFICAAVAVLIVLVAVWSGPLAQEQVRPKMLCERVELELRGTKHSLGELHLCNDATTGTNCWIMGSPHGPSLSCVASR